MSKVDTLPEFLRPLMDGCSVETPFCCVCGRTYPLNRHHVVRRSAGKLYRHGVEMPKPTVMLCGSGNAGGCHGLAHSGRLHFRWVRSETKGGNFGTYLRQCSSIGGHWEFLVTDEPCDYLHALDLEGWTPLREEL